VSLYNVFGPIALSIMLLVGARVVIGLILDAAPGEGTGVYWLCLLMVGAIEAMVIATAFGWVTA
jgi:hypothetical protein